MKTNDIVVFSRRIARELIKSRKFELVDIRANTHDNSKTVYYFARTKQLEMYLEVVHDIKVD